MYALVTMHLLIATPAGPAPLHVHWEARLQATDSTIEDKWLDDLSDTTMLGSVAAENQGLCLLKPGHNNGISLGLYKVLATVRNAVDEQVQKVPSVVSCHEILFESTLKHSGEHVRVGRTVTQRAVPVQWRSRRSETTGDIRKARTRQSAALLQCHLQVRCVENWREFGKMHFLHRRTRRALRVRIQ